VCCKIKQRFTFPYEQVICTEFCWLNLSGNIPFKILEKRNDTDNIQILVNILYVFQRHPDGVAQVTFREPEAADAFVALFNGFWFG
jgi:hypothetical protein